MKKRQTFFAMNATDADNINTNEYKYSCNVARGICFTQIWLGAEIPRDNDSINTNEYKYGCDVTRV